MYRSPVSCVLLVLAALVLVRASAKAAPEKPAPDNEVPVWDWTMTDEKDKKVGEGRFVVRGFELWNGKGKKVGSYEDKEKDHVKVEISEGHLKGTLELVKEAEGTWKGEMDNPKGGKYKVTVIFHGVRK